MSSSLPFDSLVFREPLGHPDFNQELHPVLEKILANRGLLKDSQLSDDLTNIHDPFLLRGMREAVSRLYRALKNQEKIIIVGDFDADGATSTALMMLALDRLGFENVSFEVPNRFEYGYGLSEKIVSDLLWQNPALLITVDNGISSFDGVALARKQGIDVIITDHHLPSERLPEALAIVNPNQLGCEFPEKNLAGVGVAFHLLLALRKYLREQGWFVDGLRLEPNLAEFLDLVALGTYADVVSLDQYNRMLVSQGIKRMRKGRMRPGLRAMLDVAGKAFQQILASDLGFVLGPRLNAAGRLDDMSQGIWLMLSDSEELCREIALSLEDLNRDRKQIQDQMQIEAEAFLGRLDFDAVSSRAICLYDPLWHQGVVGLLASRVKEQMHCPVFVFANDEASGQLKGSGRSIKGIHLRDVLDEVASRHPGLINKFGGHAMAAGLQISETELKNFESALLEVLSSRDEQFFKKQVTVDGELQVEDFNLYLADILVEALPWGQSLPEPQFYGEFSLLNQRVVAEKHLKLKLAPLSNPQRLLDAIHFNMDQGQWPDQNCCKVAVVYRLSVNEFRGVRSLQLMVDYIWPLGQEAA